MAPRKTKREYAAALRRPIAPPKTPEEETTTLKDMENVLRALLLHYEIDAKGGEVPWLQLASALMFDYVPAFRQLGGIKLGRPRRGEDYLRARGVLYSDVNRLTREGHTVGSALATLEKDWRRHPKRNPFSKERNLKTLRKDFKQAGQDWQRAMAKALLMKPLSDPSGLAGEFTGSQSEGEARNPRKSAARVERGGLPGGLFGLGKPPGVIPKR